VIAPHPDDEILGVGGTMLRRKAEGGEIAWLIVTGISADAGWSHDRVAQRANEIERVAEFFAFDRVDDLNLPAAALDTVPVADLVAEIARVLHAFEPADVYVSHVSDVHSDHRIIFEAAASATKWFRQPSVKRIFAYETLSETDFGLGRTQGFHPNVFVDIEPYLERKLQGLSIYGSELGNAPFPRSLEAVRALAVLRGAASGYLAAEAFELLRDRS
jgi:LmbE family N-acetylglucosaminyl deacetylase